MKFTNLFSALVLGGAALAAVRCGPEGSTSTGTPVITKLPDGGTPPRQGGGGSGEGGGTAGW